MWTILPAPRRARPASAWRARGTRRLNLGCPRLRRIWRPDLRLRSPIGRRSLRGQLDVFPKQEQEILGSEVRRDRYPGQADPATHRKPHGQRGADQEPRWTKEPGRTEVRHHPMMSL